ncbi:MAG: AAA family ATPase, partial [Chloroflexota bacterium]
MKLKQITIENYRSIVNSGEIRIESLQAFVGENNAGKSNILHAIECFLTSGAANIESEDFFKTDKPILIKAVFEELNAVEKSNLRPYLVG